MKLLLMFRWKEDLRFVADLIDHSSNEVWYLLEGDSGPVSEEKAAKVVRVDRFSDVDLVVDKLNGLGGRPKFDRILSFSEKDLIEAALLRQKLGVSGYSSTDVLRFRDKVLMKGAVSAAGLRVPRYLAPRSFGEVVEFVKRNGASIVKPRRGAASKGVALISSENFLDLSENSTDWDHIEVEEFIDLPVFHLDGFVGPDGKIEYIHASKYVGSCLEYEGGAPLGSVGCLEKTTHGPLRDFAQAVSLALGLRASPFHLEVFWDEMSSPIFLEIGARLGGGEIVSQIKEVLSVDLFAAWLTSMVGTNYQKYVSPKFVGESVLGWVMIPCLKGKSATVKQIESDVLKSCKTLNKARLSRIGTKFSGEISYTDLPAYVWFYGRKEDVERDVRIVMNGLKVVWV